ncbi:DUF397 domain-containing protein [Streptomyces sp. 3N207]|uniref:DUF397 domain-containing protein n=1 Tax=Streptomyces sp. 3N207 TaxID=3457417 RepID=UPI003FD17034
MNERPAWIKSSYSDGQGGNCVEWAPGLHRWPRTQRSAPRPLSTGGASQAA